MKLIICFTTLLMAATSFAQSPPTQVTPLPPAPVLRQGTLRAFITKSRFVKKDDSYEIVDEIVCKKDLPIDVSDLRSSKGSLNTTIISCDTVLAKKRQIATVLAQASVDTIKLNGDGPSDVFSFAGGLVIRPENDPAIQTDFSFSTQTRDINTNSLINSIGTKSMLTCTPVSCTVTNTEVITATVEFLGK